MPLIVPGLSTNQGENIQQEWMNKLMGKKLSDEKTDEINFAKSELPKEHRVIPAGEMVMTMDYNPNRMNIHLAEDGTVNYIDFK